MKETLSTYHIPFQEYENEGTYISPSEISHEAVSRIKSRKIGAKILGL